MWDPQGSSQRLEQRRDEKAMPAGSGHSYVVLFDYGSVVFLHFTEHQREVRDEKREREREEGRRGLSFFGV